MNISSRTRSGGTKIGDDMIWVEVKRCAVDNGEEVAVVTVRRSNFLGTVIARAIASRDLANDLRSAASIIDNLLGEIEQMARPAEAA